MKRTLLVLLLTLALAFPVSPALARATCGGFLCGQVHNSRWSDRELLVTGGWRTKRPRQLVRPGRTAPYQDDDGWYLPYGCDALVIRHAFHEGRVLWLTTPGWQKTRDHQRDVVQLDC